jgi:RimJ/RimL family protein N-acetyltransferase
MSFSNPLFRGERICFTGINHDQDPQVEATWTQDLSYLRMLQLEPAFPLSAARIKKKYEKIEKMQEEKRRVFHFQIRTLDEERLLGFCQLYHIEWPHGTAWIQIGIGSPSDRGQGYGSEAISMLLRIAYMEMNLNHLGADIYEYNPAGRRLFEKYGFVREVCRRQAIQRDGRIWDEYIYGLLRREWKALQEGEA